MVTWHKEKAFFGDARFVTPCKSDTNYRFPLALSEIDFRIFFVCLLAFLRKFD